MSTTPANHVSGMSSEVKSEERGDLSSNEMAIDEHAIFERKMALVNSEIDKLGFGKYQMCIWMLCGMGYFIDLALVKAVALMATAMFQEMDVPGGRQGLIYTCSNVGLAWSRRIRVRDHHGHHRSQWAFQLTCLITAVFGMLMAACKHNYDAICGIYFLACIGLGGNIPIDAAMHSAFTSRPSFLVSQGREQNATDVLHTKIAKFNKDAAPTLTIEDFRLIGAAAGGSREQQQQQNRTIGSTAKDVVMDSIRSLSFLRGLFLSKLQCFSFILLGLSYMSNYWSFNLAGYFLPIVLLRKNVDSGASSVTDPYRQYVYIYLPGVLGAMAALFSIQIPLLGRQWSLVISATLQGLSDCCPVCWAEVHRRGQGRRSLAWGW
ncbi:uncharacterized protein BJX67DRAFT_385333 [Aspergillus lucknowensis]|uniref:Uncharacterized protein n=1 Tax=Aspergillus lucknowensis TaxID=176173 RepID=A0ABR4LDY0_9EURO